MYGMTMLDGGNQVMDPLQHVCLSTTEYSRAELVKHWRLNHALDETVQALVVEGNWKISFECQLKKPLPAGIVF